MTPKQWIENVVEFGPMVNDPSPMYRPQIHHVVGRKGKHNKTLIGPWFILYLPWRYHDVASNDPLNVTHWKHEFTDAFGLQSKLFAQRVELIHNAGLEIPDKSILDAIADTGI